MITDTGEAPDDQKPNHGEEGNWLITSIRKAAMLRVPDIRGVVEETPGAYKDVTDVVNAAEAAGRAKRVARVVPMLA